MSERREVASSAARALLLGLAAAAFFSAQVLQAGIVAVLVAGIVGYARLSTRS